jgi:hypothetical protein
MANETATLATPEQIREAIGVLAAELVNLREMQTATAKLVQGMDTRIKAMTGLVDHHHTILTKLAGLPPRPKRDPLAN